MSYALWKLIHIVGVVAFLGNITTGLFWAGLAHRRKDFGTIASTFDGIIQSDRWFTIPGVFAVLIGGFGTAINGGIPILRTGWILWPALLFAVSGILFSIWVGPLQKKIQQYVASTPQTDESWQHYHGLYKKWERWGLAAWIAPVAAMVVMVLKLPIPGI